MRQVIPLVLTAIILAPFSTNSPTIIAKVFAGPLTFLTGLLGIKGVIEKDMEKALGYLSTAAIFFELPRIV
ncbi:hypothetical protein [Pyrococcus kukulkanii]|uniref:hypothetical protein n=1 Tax=Pyrococcus kukulkanii TaxID=1609559 RepID=UPI00356574FB